MFCRTQSKAWYYDRSIKRMSLISSPEPHFGRQGPYVGTQLQAVVHAMEVEAGFGVPLQKLSLISVLVDTI